MPGGLFPHAHATHPQWRMAAALVLAQLRARMALPAHASAPTLGLLYITDHLAADAAAILDHLAAELPEVTDWAGTVGVGIAASGVEYFDEPAIAVMLCELPTDQYRVFSGVAPLAATSAFTPACALVHADGHMPDLADLLAELAGRTRSGYLFGGLTASRSVPVQFAVGGNGNLRGQGGASGVFSGGMSGVAFGPQVALISRVTQGCQPLPGAHHTVTEADGHVAVALDGEPALDVLLRDLGVSLDQPRAVIERLRSTLAGLSPPRGRSAARPRTGHFGDEVQVRHLIGLDPARRAVAVAERLEAGMQLAFCRRDPQAARADLMRICAEIREALEPALAGMDDGPDADADADADGTGAPRRIAGALYVSCAGRGGPHFGAPSAELQIVRHALGDVPLVGFFAGGEIAHRQVYGYTGVLTVFTTPVA